MCTALRIASNSRRRRRDPDAAGDDHAIVDRGPKLTLDFRRGRFVGAHEAILGLPTAIAHLLHGEIDTRSDLLGI